MIILETIAPGRDFRSLLKSRRTLKRCENNENPISVNLRYEGLENVMCSETIPVSASFHEKIADSFVMVLAPHLSTVA